MKAPLLLSLAVFSASATLADTPSIQPLSTGFALSPQQPVIDKAYWTIPSAGKAVISANVRGNEELDSFLLERGIITTNAKIKGKREKYENVLSAHYTEKSKDVIFSLGYDDLPQAGRRFYQWNRTSNAVAPASARYIAYSRFETSPDGQWCAYASNGETQGIRWDKKTQLELRVFNVKSQRERLVAVNNGVVHSFVWRSNTLFYTAFPKAARGEQVARPALYSLSFDKPNAQPKLIAKNVYRPSLSPDGKRIAFFGPENLKRIWPLRRDWPENPYGDALCVMNADGTGRKALNREDRAFPQLLWLDNENLLTLKQTEFSPKSLAQVRSVNVVKGIWSAVLAQIEAKDYKKMSQYITTWPQFELLRIRPDSHSIAVKVREINGLGTLNWGYSRYEGTVTLRSIDLRDGKNEEIMRVGLQESFDWQPEIEPKKKR